MSLMTGAFPSPPLRPPSRTSISSQQSDSNNSNSNRSSSAHSSVPPARPRKSSRRYRNGHPASSRSANSVASEPMSRDASSSVSHTSSTGWDSCSDSQQLAQQGGNSSDHSSAPSASSSRRASRRVNGTQEWVSQGTRLLDVKESRESLFTSPIASSSTPPPWETLLQPATPGPSSDPSGSRVPLDQDAFEKTPTQLRELAKTKRKRTSVGKVMEWGSRGSRGSVSTLASFASSGGDTVYEDALSSMDEGEDGETGQGDAPSTPAHKRSQSRSTPSRSVKKRSSSSLRKKNKSQSQTEVDGEPAGAEATTSQEQNVPPPPQVPAPEPAVVPTTSTDDQEVLSSPTLLDGQPHPLSKSMASYSLKRASSDASNSRSLPSPLNLSLSKSASVPLDLAALAPAMSPLSPCSPNPPALHSAPAQVSSTIIPLRRYSAVPVGRSVTPTGNFPLASTTTSLRRNSTQSSTGSRGSWQPKPLVLTPARTVNTPLTSASAPGSTTRRSQSALGHHPTSTYSPRSSISYGPGRPISPFGIAPGANIVRRRSMGYADSPGYAASATAAAAAAAASMSVRANRDSTSSYSGYNYRTYGRNRSASEDTGLTRLTGESPDSSLNGWSEGEKDKSVEGSPREKDKEWEEGRKSGGATNLEVVEEGRQVTSWDSGDSLAEEERGRVVSASLDEQIDLLTQAAKTSVDESSGIDLEKDRSILNDEDQDWPTKSVSPPPVIELSLPSPPHGPRHHSLLPPFHSRSSMENDADDEHEVIRDPSPEIDGPLSPPPAFPLPGLPKNFEPASPSTSSSGADTDSVTGRQRRLPSDASFVSALGDEDSIGPKGESLKNRRGTAGTIATNASPKTLQYSSAPSTPNMPPPVPALFSVGTPGVTKTPTQPQTDAEISPRTPQAATMTPVIVNQPVLTSTPVKTVQIPATPSPVGQPIVIKSKLTDRARPRAEGGGSRSSRYVESSGRHRLRSEESRSTLNSELSGGRLSTSGSRSTLDSTAAGVGLQSFGTRSNIDLSSTTPISIKPHANKSSVDLHSSSSHNFGSNSSLPVWPPVDDGLTKTVSASQPSSAQKPVQISGRHDSMDGRGSSLSTSTSSHTRRILREARDPRTQIDRPDPVMRELLSESPPLGVQQLQAAQRARIQGDPNGTLRRNTDSAKKNGGGKFTSKILGSFLTSPKNKSPTLEQRATPPHRPVRNAPVLGPSILLKPGMEKEKSTYEIPPSHRSLDHTMPILSPGSPLDLFGGPAPDSSGGHSSIASEVEELDEKRRSVSSTTSSIIRAPPRPYQLPPGLALGIQLPPGLSRTVDPPRSASSASSRPPQITIAPRDKQSSRLSFNQSTTSLGVASNTQRGSVSPASISSSNGASVSSYHQYYHQSASPRPRSHVSFSDQQQSGPRPIEIQPKIEIPRRNSSIPSGAPQQQNNYLRSPYNDQLSDGRASPRSFDSRSGSGKKKSNQDLSPSAGAAVRETFRSQFLER
ncbi:hypothetical protein T439DRAFT_377887 [Meredithblackwellia eburnea MCA 4105]